MTAEIVVMNKSSIAIAADSAATIRSGQNTKIFNSVNKLFALSDIEPVGIMIYNNASIMGLGWEQIIKEYKLSHDEIFDTLKEYAVDFLNFIEEKTFIPTEVQNNHLYNLSYELIYEVINNHKEEKAKSEDPIYPLDTFLETQIQIMNQAKNCINSENISEKTYQEVIKNNVDKILRIIEKSDSTISYDGYEELFTEVISLYLQKDSMANYTGVVFMGFGSKEIFPTTIEYHIELIANNKLKYYLNKENTCNFTSEAWIMPFAQSDIVDNFLTGIDPSLASFIYSFIENLLQENESFINKTINLEEEDSITLNTIMKDFSKEKLKDYLDIFSKYKYDNFIQPIVDSVAHLPKEELAIMAETLVSLTSFKRKMTLSDQETVGGPIDVAVISKGDGFIWIKRKHYFDVDLNKAYINRKARL